VIVDVPDGESDVIVKVGGEMENANVINSD